MANTNPVLISSGVTVTAASIVPAVEWALNGFVHPIPESVSAILAGLLVAAVHLGIQYVNTKVQASKDAVSESPIPPTVNNPPTVVNIPQFTIAPNAAPTPSIGQAPISLAPKA